MVKRFLAILILCVAGKLHAQIADATPREYQHFILNVPHNWYDSTTYETLYLFPPYNDFTKTYRPFYTVSMRNTTFDIKEKERTIFMEQFAREVVANKQLKARLISKNLQGNRAEINYTTMENKLTIYNKLVLFFDAKRFVILSSKDIADSPFAMDTESFLSTITFK
jgi:hypothetical protein